MRWPWRASLFLSALIGIGLGAPLPAAKAAPPVTPVELVPLRDKIQHLIALRDKLDGVRIDVVYNEDGLLRLQGVKGRDDQDRLFVEMITDHEDDLAPFHAAFKKGNEPKKWIVGKLTLVSVDDFRERLQIELGQNPFLRGVRIDRVYFDAVGNPTLAGVWWSREFGETSKSETIPAAVDDLCTKLIVHSWEAYSSEGPELNIRVLTGAKLENPLIGLRRLIAEDPQLDGLRADDAFYDDRGKLVVVGTQADDAQWKLLCNKLESTVKGPEWRSWVAAHNRSEKPGVDIASNILFNATHYPINEVIASLTADVRLTNLTSSDGKFLNDKIRIDRLYYNEANQVALSGIRWNDDKPDEPAALRSHFEKHLGERWPTVIPPAEFRIGEAVNVDKLMSLESTPKILPAIAALIQAHSNLDGVRLDTGYYQNGVLHLVGLMSESGQQAELQGILDERLDKSVAQNYAPTGFVIDPPRLVSMGELVRRLRKRSFENSAVDGIWIQRCFFNPQRQLVCSFEAWNKDAAEAAIRAELSQELAAPEWSACLESHPAGEVRLTEQIPNLLATLRKQVSDKQEMDGVLVGGARFDEGRQLRLSGLVGNDRQLSLLNTLTARTIDSSDGLKRCYVEGFTADQRDFESLPLEELLLCIKQFMIGFSELDGVVITRAFHDPQGVFVLSANVRREPQAPAMSRILGYALLQDNHGRRRLEFNPKVNTGSSGTYRNVFVQSSIVPSEYDYRGAIASVTKGIKRYQTSDYGGALLELDKAVQLYPGMAEAWYVRGLCYLALGKVQLAQRDVYRATKIDDQSAGRTDRHYLLRKIQGRQRIEFEKICDEAKLYSPYVLLCSQEVDSRGNAGEHDKCAIENCRCRLGR